MALYMPEVSVRRWHSPCTLHSSQTIIPASFFAMKIPVLQPYFSLSLTMSLSPVNHTTSNAYTNLSLNISL